MEIVVCGRNVEVPQHFREHTAEKLARVERYDHKIVQVAVKLSHEPNPRRAKSCQRVEITGRGRGPVVRGEGCAADFYRALDQAVARVEARLRRTHDRRRVHHGRRVPISVAEATGARVGAEAPEEAATAAAPDPDETGSGPGGATVGAPATRRAPDDLVVSGVDGTGPGTEVDTTAWDPPDADEDDPRPGRIVRRKEHHGLPMSVDDALSQMELVGHDFFLFCDAATGRPSVVYRRRGFDYGVIALV